MVFNSDVFVIKERERESNEHEHKHVRLLLFLFEKQGLDMDVHNTMIVFPMVVVCPIESFDMNHTNILAAELG